MNRPDPDDLDLRERFAELRDEVSRVVPPFQALSARREPRRVRRWTPLTAAAATAAVLALVFFTGRNAPVELDPEFDAVVWRAPTDFLLETPGSGLFDGMPKIDFGIPLPAGAQPEGVREDSTS